MVIIPFTKKCAQVFYMQKVLDRTGCLTNKRNDHVRRHVADLVHLSRTFHCKDKINKITSNYVATKNYNKINERRRGNFSTKMKKKTIITDHLDNFCTFLERKNVVTTCAFRRFYVSRHD